MLTLGLKFDIICLQVIKEVTQVDDKKNKDVSEIISIMLNLNDQNRQLMLFGAQLLEKSELMAKTQQTVNKSA